MVKTVGLVGTSLGSLLLGKALHSRGFDVTYFEQGAIGGAWQLQPIASLPAPSFNNIAWTTSGTHQLSKTKEWLQLQGFSLGQVTLNAGERAREILMGEFLPLTLTDWLLNETQLLREPLQSVSATKDNVIADGYEFDFFYITRNTLLSRLIIDGAMQQFLSYESNNSRHLRVLFREDTVTANIPYFSEQFDGAFDRYGFSTHVKGLFIGRVARPLKGQSDAVIMAASSTLASYRSEIITHDSQFYSNSRLTEHAWAAVVSGTAGSKIRAVEFSDVTSIAQIVSNELSRMAGSEREALQPHRPLR